MKKLLFVVALTLICLFTSNTFSQLTFQRTSPSIVYRSADSTDVASWATVTNTGSSPINVQIDAYLISGPNIDSLVGICDWYLCHPPGILHYSTNCSVGSHNFDIYANLSSFNFYITIRVKLSYNGDTVSQDFGLSTFPVGIKQIGSVVGDFKLNQNYPNPFNPSTKIGFTIPKGDFVDLRVYDLLGREVAVLSSGYVNAGEYEIEWDARNLASGMYYYRLKTPDNVAVKKMTLVK
ncbi:MAG: T9SS type A sorting domain-containing protein [Ignavibacteria bacterium]